MMGMPSALNRSSGGGAAVLSVPSCGGGSFLGWLGAILCQASLRVCGAGAAVVWSACLLIVSGEGVAGVGVVG